MNEDRVVLCMKWGPLYPNSYVNVLYHAVQAYLPLEHRFVCLTDEPDGLDPAIEHFPIPEIGVDQRHWYHGAWPKLSVFLKELYDLKGRCLFIDLDSVICGDLSCFFDNHDPLTVIDTSRNWWQPNAKEAPLAGTGVFTFTIGALPHIVHDFQADPNGAYDKCDIEQVFVQNAVPDIKYWPRPWVLSFKRHLRRGKMMDLIMPPETPADPARIIAFHGDPRPNKLLGSHGRVWGKFPHLGRAPVSWMVEYWERFGGDLP